MISRTATLPGMARLTFHMPRLAFVVANIIDVLVIEHQVFLTLFEEIERTLARLKSVGEIRILCRLIAGLLHNHGEEEANLIYIALDHVLLERHQLTRLNHDHHELDVVLKRVEELEDLGEARRQFKITLSMARSHFSDEEQNVFPVIERVLQRTTLVELGNAWKSRWHVSR